MEDSRWLLKPLAGKESFFFGFQRLRHVRIGLPFVSACLFRQSPTVPARGGFNGGGVVLSANGQGAGSPSDMFMWQHHLTALTPHRQTSSNEKAVYPPTQRRYLFSAKCKPSWWTNFMVFFNIFGVHFNVCVSTYRTVWLTVSVKSKKEFEERWNLINICEVVFLYCFRSVWIFILKKKQSCPC